MTMTDNVKRRERYLDFAFYIFVFLMITSFIILQPFGDGPDEANRYKVTDFICRYGFLPNGADPELHIHGYGASYAYQPILPYIIQGFVNRFVSLFTQSFYVLLFTARMVNAVTGVIMAVFVRKIAKIVFENPLTGWVFSVLICLLPQSLFLHSYVNTDSMAAMSTAVIIYAILQGYQNDFKKKTCITLSVGISLCALSYYNAYGIILCAIALFILYFFERKDGKLHLRFKDMVLSGLFVSVIVLALISWWFIRNYILYDGDLMGMTARRLNAIATSTPEYSPATKFTYYNGGLTLLDLIRTPNFKMLLTNSFIGLFGPMCVYMHTFTYRTYKFIYLIGALALLIPVHKRTVMSKYSKYQIISFNILMFVDMMIVTFLCMYYNYTWDYQPQGRYLLPMLIPLMYFVTLGLEKLFQFLKERLPSKIWRGYFNPDTIRTVAFLSIISFVVLALLNNLVTVLIPKYLEADNTIQWFIQKFNL